MSVHRMASWNDWSSRSLILVIPSSDKRIVISIKDQPIKDSMLSSANTRTTRMVDAAGHAYTCRLPAKMGAASEKAAPVVGAQGMAAEGPSADATSSALLQAGQLQPEEGEAAAAPLKTPEELLEKLASLCFFRQEGLWIYEVGADMSSGSGLAVGWQWAGADMSSGSRPHRVTFS